MAWGEPVKSQHKFASSTESWEQTNAALGYKNAEFIPQVNKGFLV